MLSKENICPQTSLGKHEPLWDVSNIYTSAGAAFQHQGCWPAGRPAKSPSFHPLCCCTELEFTVSSTKPYKGKNAPAVYSYDDKAVVQPKLNGQYK